MTKKEETKGMPTGAFLAVVLLKEPKWDRAAYEAALKKDWNLTWAPKEADAEPDPEGVLLEEVDGMIAAVSFMPDAVPQDEAVDNAQNNYMWPGAVEAAKAHKAHLLISVPTVGEASAKKRGELFVKLVTAALADENALGIYANGTVYEPAFYLRGAEAMKADHIPLFNWVWIGLYETSKGINAYTTGLECFGHAEIEVLEVEAQPMALHRFVTTIVAYILEAGAVLKDGETVGLSANDKHEVKLSDGVALPGKTLKVSFGRGFDN